MEGTKSMSKNTSDFDIAVPGYIFRIGETGTRYKVLQIVRHNREVLVRNLSDGYQFNSSIEHLKRYFNRENLVDWDMEVFLKSKDVMSYLI